MRKKIWVLAMIFFIFTKEVIAGNIYFSGDRVEKKLH